MKFKQLTQSQQKAVGFFCDFIESDKKFACIIGHAGTGKSTLVKFLFSSGLQERVNLFKSIKGSFRNKYFISNKRLLATTNKACGIYTKDNLLCNTVHSFFKIPPKDKRVSFYLHRVPTPNKALYIIDEASMLSEKIFKYLNDFVWYTDSKILFIGDPKQLPPVNSNFDIFNLIDYKYTLDSVVRYSNNNLKNFISHLIDCIDNNNKINFKVDNNSIVLNNEAARYNIIKYMYDTNIFRDLNNNYLNILSYTNKASENYYKFLLEESNKIYGDNRDGLLNPIQPNDIYLVKTTIYENVGSKLYWIPGSSFICIRSTVGKCVKYKSNTIQYTLITFNLIDSPIEYTCIVTEVDKNLIRKIKKELRYVSFSDDLNDIFIYPVIDISLPMVSTIHKAQGSTYKNVVVDLNDLNRVDDINLLNRLLYVACSRASEKVFFVGKLSPEKGILYE